MEFTAPTTPGVYWATYRLRGPDGIFGDSFGLEVQVREPVPPTYSISGRVVNGNGRGLAAVRIVANGPLINSVLTDSDGRYELTSLPAGSYSVNALQEGYTFDREHSISLPASNTVVNFIGTSAPPPPPRPIALLVHGMQEFNLSAHKHYNCTPISFSPEDQYLDGNASQPDWHSIGSMLIERDYEVYLANWTTRPLGTITIEEAAKN